MSAHFMNNLKAINQLKSYSNDDQLKKVFIVMGNKDPGRLPLIPVLNNIPHNILIDHKFKSINLTPTEKISQAQQQSQFIQQPPINLWNFTSLTLRKSEQDGKILFIDYEFDEENDTYTNISVGLVFNFLFKIFVNKIRILLLLSQTEIVEPATIPQIFEKFLFYFNAKSLLSLKTITTILVTGYESEDKAVQEAHQIIYLVQQQELQQPLINQFLTDFPQNKIIAFPLKSYENGNQLLQKICLSYQQNQVPSTKNISIDFFDKNWSKSNEGNLLLECPQFREIIFSYMMDFRTLIKFVKAIFDKLNKSKINQSAIIANLELYQECGIIFQYKSKAKFQYSIKPLVNVRQNVVSCAAFIRENLKPLKNFVQQQILDFIQSVISFYEENLKYIEKNITNEDTKKYYSDEAKDLFKFAIDYMCQNQLTSIMEKQYQNIQVTEKDEEVLEKSFAIIDKYTSRENQLVVKSIHKVVKILRKENLYEQSIQCLGYINNYVMMDHLINEGIRNEKIRSKYFKKLFTQFLDTNQKDLATKVINILLTAAKNEEQVKQINNKFRLIFDIKAENRQAFTIDTQKIMKKYMQTRK